MSKINLSIPKPCHENWEEMSSASKGKFCNSCQKNVFDFTASSDREIVNAFEKNKNLCGRFLETQLNRDLVIPKEKSSVWLAATSAMISFIGFGSQEVSAQGNVKTEQTDSKLLNSSEKSQKEDILVSGIVYGDNKTPVPHLGIYIKATKIGETNENGNFSITVNQRAWITFRNDFENDYDATQYHVKNDRNTNIEINLVKTEVIKKISIVAGGAIAVKVKKISFLGRIFQSIRNLFR